MIFARLLSKIHTSISQKGIAEIPSMFSPDISPSIFQKYIQQFSQKIVVGFLKKNLWGNCHIFFFMNHPNNLPEVSPRVLPRNLSLPSLPSEFCIEVHQEILVVITVLVVQKFILRCLRPILRFLRGFHHARNYSPFSPSASMSCALVVHYSQRARFRSWEDKSL